ncbi:C4-dicarboxylate ABC transporter substrate-binding protein [Candidatus Magnetomorum sp. HK-1]|nr:C4-dicarboxylate ABC transporter substrate-binding protein [Candidatus Magnetomorum sp. HK-1]
MNKRIIWLIIGMFFILVQFSNPVFARTYRLTYSIFFPESHGQCKVGMDWAKEIEKRTNGQVVITAFPGGTLTKAKQCYDGVVKGVTDIGMSVFAYTRGRFPVMEAVDLPLGYSSGLLATQVVNSFYQQVQPKELSDVQVMYLHAHGPGLFHTQKPVQKLEDLIKMKIRSTGLSTNVVEALGAVPVPMPQGSTYDALKKGIVEGTFGPMEALKGWRQAEVIHYSTDCKDIGFTTAMFVVMNRSKWNSLPKNIQDVFIDVNKKWIDVHGNAWDALDKEGEEYTRQRKNFIFNLSEEEIERWQKAVEPLVYNYSDKMKAKNLPGKEYIDRLTKLIQEHQNK